MSKIDLNKIGLRYSDLTGRVYISRVGVDPLVALDQREARNDLLSTVVAWLTDGNPNGSVLSFEGGGKKYELELRVTP